MTIHVQVRFFARLRQQLGQESLALKLPGGSRVRDLAGLIETERGLSLGGVMVAVNETYATPDQVLQDGDEVALLPPVAGGAA